jgi:hypothetical protein
LPFHALVVPFPTVGIYLPCPTKATARAWKGKGVQG